jgi:hypothetical protein
MKRKEAVVAQFMILFQHLLRRSDSDNDETPDMNFEVSHSESENTYCDLVS